jgi:hypothetical protein
LPGLPNPQPVRPGHGEGSFVALRGTRRAGWSRQSSTGAGVRR